MQCKLPRLRQSRREELDNNDDDAARVAEASDDHTVRSDFAESAAPGKLGSTPSAVDAKGKAGPKTTEVPKAISKISAKAGPPPRSAEMPTQEQVVAANLAKGGHYATRTIQALAKDSMFAGSSTGDRLTVVHPVA